MELVSFCGVIMLRVAFYKGKGQLVDKIIRIATRGTYSHCELLFPDGQMFSSDAWSGGVRWNDNYNLDNWDIIEIDIPDFKLSTLEDWCTSKQNKKYDWLGVVRFIVPFLKQDPDKWFCSELCGAGLKFIGVIPVKTKTSKLSPQELYTILVNKGDK